MLAGTEEAAAMAGFVAPAPAGVLLPDQIKANWALQYTEWAWSHFLRRGRPVRRKYLCGHARNPFRVRVTNGLSVVRANAPPQSGRSYAPRRVSRVEQPILTNSTINRFWEDLCSRLEVTVTRLQRSIPGSSPVGPSRNCPRSLQRKIHYLDSWLSRHIGSAH